MNRLDTITMLNRLILTSKNGESSLRAAAEEAHHGELKRALYDYSRFFADTAKELQETVRRLGGEPREAGSFDNTLHRTWLHLKQTALGRDEYVLLDTVEQDEVEAEARFAEAAQEETDPEIQALLARKFQAAQSRHSAIRQWRSGTLSG